MLKRCRNSPQMHKCHFSLFLWDIFFKTLFKEFYFLQLRIILLYFLLLDIYHNYIRQLVLLILSKIWFISIDYLSIFISHYDILHYLCCKCIMILSKNFHFLKLLYFYTLSVQHHIWYNTKYSLFNLTITSLLEES